MEKKYIVINGHKYCRKCDKLLPITEFKPNLKIKSGLHSCCTNCYKIDYTQYNNKNRRIKKTGTNIVNHRKETIFNTIIDGHKSCTKCLENKPISEFCKSNITKSGLHYNCKKCKNIKYLELKSRKLNGENFVFEKKCKICDEIKPRDLFTVSSSSDGLFPYCKSCYSKISNKRYYDGLLTGKTREVMNKYRRKRYNSDENYRTKQNLSKRIWFEIRKKGGSKNWTSVEKLLKYRVTDLLDIIGHRPSNSHHLDHKIPCSWFTDDCPIDISFSIDNLWWVTKEYNLNKNNYWCDKVPEMYLKKITPFLKQDLIYEEDFKN